MLLEDYCGCVILDGCFVGCRRILWRVTPFSVLWSILKEMNDRIFRGSSSSSSDQVQVFKSHSEDRKMGSGKKEVTHLNLNDIFF